MTQSVSGACQMIEELGDAGKEFEDVLQQYFFVGETLNDIEKLFRNSSITPSFMGDYERRLRMFKARFNEIDAILRQIFTNMYSKSFLRRLQRKQNIVGNDMRRLTGKLLAFNQSLQNLMTAFTCQLSCTLISIAHEGARTGTRDSIASYTGSSVDLRSRYIEAALKSQSRDWDGAYELEAERSWGTARELGADSTWGPRYELEADNTWGINTTTLIEDKEPQLTSSDTKGSISERDVPSWSGAPWLGTRSASVDAGIGGRGYRFDPTSQLRPTDVSTTQKVREQPSRSSVEADERALGLTLQEKYAIDAKRFQDDEWMEWTQARRDIS